jgi:hypothetical protein
MVGREGKTDFSVGILYFQPRRTVMVMAMMIRAAAVAQAR